MPTTESTVPAEYRAIVADTASSTIEVAMSGPARPGTLALFAGVLALAGLDISWASVRLDREGTVHDTFQTSPLEVAAREQHAARISSLLARYADDRPALAAALREHRRVHRASPGTPAQVSFEFNSELTTGVRVAAPDRPGLLHDLARTLSDHGMRVRSVSVLTVSGEARDVFRVVDGSGSPPRGRIALESLARDLERASA